MHNKVLIHDDKDKRIEPLLLLLRPCCRRFLGARRANVKSANCESADALMACIWTPS